MIEPTCQHLMEWPWSLCENNQVEVMLLMRLLGSAKAGKSNHISAQGWHHALEALGLWFPRLLVQESALNLLRMKVIHAHEDGSYELVAQTLLRHIKECVEDIDYLMIPEIEP